VTIMTGSPAASVPGVPPPPPPIEEKKISPEESAKLASWVQQSYERAKSSRSKIERQWYMNMSFNDGRQYVQSIPVPGAGTPFKFTTPPAPPWRVRPVFNKIRPIVRQEIAKLTKERPTASVIPSSADEIDLMAAQAAEQIWNSLYRDLDIHRELRKSVWWSTVCGTGYLKIWWDDNKIDKLSNQMGIICVKSETPFHVYIPNLREPDIEDQPWVIHTSVISVEEATYRYKDDLDGPLTGNVSSEDDILNSAYLDLQGTENRQKNSVLVLEMWIKPGMTQKFPDGGLITVVGGKVVQLVDTWPYNAERYPFVKLDSIENGQYYARSPIVDLIPLQREYNRTRAQIIEAKNRMAKPQLLAAAGAIDPSKITTEPGQIIEYRLGFPPPQPLPLQGLPAYVLQEIDRLNLEFDDISGQNQISRGGVPPGVHAATAIQYLMEQADVKISGAISSIEEGVEKLAYIALNLVSQFWTTPRVVRTTGSNSSFDTMLFKGSDIRDNTDIKVEAGSALPTSKAAKQAFIMDLMKMNFIPADEGLKLLEVGGVDTLYEDLEMDDRQIQRENIRMQQVSAALMDEYNTISGEYDQWADPESGLLTGPDGKPIPPPDLPVPINTWDDHGKHIDLHNKFRKGQAFEALPDHVKELFDMHVRSHVAALMQSTMPGGDQSQSMNSSVPGEVASQNDGSYVNNVGGAGSDGNSAIATPPPDMQSQQQPQ